MMGRWFRGMMVGALLVSGCAYDPLEPSSGSAFDLVVERYDRLFTWEAPACELFVIQRAYDERAYIIEYAVRVDEVAYWVSYAIRPSQERPLVAEVHGEGGTMLLGVRAGDQDLVVVDAEDRVLLEVDDYAGINPEWHRETGATTIDPAAFEVLGCVLPLRSDLGRVPHFLLNRASGGGVGGEPGLVHSSAEAPAIVTDWASELSFLDAFAVQGACLQGDSQGPLWQCVTSRSPSRR